MNIYWEIKNSTTEIDNNEILLFLLISVLYQKRYKRERRLRGRVQQQMESELKKRSQIEEILKASGAPAEALRILAGMKFLLMLNCWL